MVDTFGTEHRPDRRAHRDAGRRRRSTCARRAILERLDLRRPIYRRTAAYGHFGRTDDDGFTWERTDRVGELREAAGLEVVTA